MYWIIIIVIILFILSLVVPFIVSVLSKPASLKYHNVGKNIIQFKLNKIPESRAFFESIPKATSIDFFNDEMFISNRDGKLFKNSQIILDLRDDKDFDDRNWEQGLLCVKLHPQFNDNKLLYLCYTVKGDSTHKTYTVVNEYLFKENSLQKIRELIRVGFGELYHHAGTLDFDSQGKLYLSTGDGGPQGDPGNYAQNLNSHRGKILQIDLTSENEDVKKNSIKIVAYGLRNPWKFSIDSQDRMFIGDVGESEVESFYIIPLKNLAAMPYNLGWNAFQGSLTKRGGLNFNDTLHPIFEYPYDKENYGGCVIGGYYLDDKEIYISGDYFGFIRALKFVNNKWIQVGLQKLNGDMRIYSFGYNKQTNKIYVLDKKSMYELYI